VSATAEVAERETTGRSPSAAGPRAGRASWSSLWTGAGAVAAAVVCAALGLAILVGTAALGMPLLAPAVLALVLALPLLLVKPVPFLVLVTVAEAANLSDVGAVNGIPKGETALLGLAVIAAILAWTRGEARLSSSPFLGVALVYLMVQTVAALVAQDVDTGLGTVAGIAKALVWPVVLMVLMLARPTGPINVARAFALTLAALSALTIFQEFVVGNDTTFAGLSNVPLVADLGGVTSRHAGPQGDPNFWGRVLVLGLPFALSLAAMAVSRLERLVWAGCALLIVGGVVMTGSRGALLAVVVVVVLWALFTGGRAAKALLFAPLVLGLAFFIPGVGSRLLTLGTINAGATTLGVGDPSLEGRVAAQKVAFHVFLDHPILGVGPGNFIHVAPAYLRKLGLNSLPLAPHNSYLEAGAEGGLLGLLSWLLLLGAAVFVVMRARLLVRAGGPVVDRDAPVGLANAVIAALAGWAVASLFLHVATFRTFLLVAALGAALDIRARRRVAQLLRDGVVVRVQPPVVVRASRSAGQALARYVVAPAVITLVLIAGTLWALSGPAATTWSSTASLQLVVKYGNSDSPAYDLDTLSRAALVRTLAGIATSTRFVREGAADVRALGGVPDGVTVEVTGSASSALVVVVATGPTAKQALDMSLAVRAAAVNYLNTVSPLYGALAVAGPPVTARDSPRFDRNLALIPLGVAAGIVVLFGVGLGVGAVRARRHRATAPPDPLRAVRGGPSWFS
jgi:O-antigen ligase